MTQKEHDKYQNEYRECCMLLGNLDEKQINSVLALLKALRQPVVICSAKAAEQLQTKNYDTDSRL